MATRARKRRATADAALAAVQELVGDDARVAALERLVHSALTVVQEALAVLEAEGHAAAAISTERFEAKPAVAKPGARRHGAAPSATALDVADADGDFAV